MLKNYNLLCPCETTSLPKGVSTAIPMPRPIANPPLKYVLDLGIQKVTLNKFLCLPSSALAVPVPVPITWLLIIEPCPCPVANAFPKPGY